MSHTRAILAFCLSGLVVSLGFPSSPANTHSTGGTTDAYTASPIFDELAERAGLKLRHFNGMMGQLFLPDVMGAGAALFDFHNDGDLAFFLLQGSAPEAPAQPASTAFPCCACGDPPST